MPKYLLFGKYSAQGAKAAAAEGLTSRKKAIDEFTKGLGMQQLGWWAVAEPQWDFAILVEGNYAPQLVAAQSLMTHGSGAFDRSEVFTLVETEVVDDAQKSMPGYRPPGGSDDIVEQII
jgi:hypothetical protein